MTPPSDNVLESHEKALSAKPKIGGPDQHEQIWIWRHIALYRGVFPTCDKTRHDKRLDFQVFDLNARDVSIKVAGVKQAVTFTRAFLADSLSATPTPFLMSLLTASSSLVSIACTICNTRLETREHAKTAAVFVQLVHVCARKV